MINEMILVQLNNGYVVRWWVCLKWIEYFCATGRSKGAGGWWISVELNLFCLFCFFFLAFFLNDFLLYFGQRSIRKPSTAGTHTQTPSMNIHPVISDAIAGLTAFYRVLPSFFLSSFQSIRPGLFDEEDDWLRFWASFHARFGPSDLEMKFGENQIRK